MARGTSRQTFVAAYNGHCNYCGDEIEEGDDIAYLDDDIACEDCWREATSDDG